MDNLTEAITRLSDILNQTSSEDWSNWVLVGVTTIYVIATFLICFFNYHSAKATAKQLEEMKASQQQNVNIQLFEKRHEAYCLLNSWHTIAKVTFGNTVTDPNTNKLLNPIEVFETMVFRDQGNIALKNLNEQLSLLNGLLWNPQGHNIVEIQKQINKLNTEMFFVVFQSCGHIKSKIDLTKYLYPYTMAEKINTFTEAFMNMALSRNIESLQKLKETYLALESSNILEQMEEQLRI